MRARRPRPISKAKRARLREAWFGTHSADEIARLVGVRCGQTVRNCWQVEKNAGRLPADQARPCFAQFAPIEIDDEADDEIDDCVTPEKNRVASDAMLAALIRVHGGDQMMRFQDMPKATLQMEIKTPPDAARVRQFAHVKDAYTRALGRIYASRKGK